MEIINDTQGDWWFARSKQPNSRAISHPIMSQNSSPSKPSRKSYPTIHSFTSYNPIITLFFSLSIDSVICLFQLFFSIYFAFNLIQIYCNFFIFSMLKNLFCFLKFLIYFNRIYLISYTVYLQSLVYQWFPIIKIVFYYSIILFNAFYSLKSLKYILFEEKK